MQQDHVSHPCPDVCGRVCVLPSPISAATRTQLRRSALKCPRPPDVDLRDVFATLEHESDVNVVLSVNLLACSRNSKHLN